MSPGEIRMGGLGKCQESVRSNHSNVNESETWGKFTSILRTAFASVDPKE